MFFGPLPVVVRSGVVRSTRIGREDGLDGIQAFIGAAVRRKENRMATAYYEVQRNAGELKRILKVEGVKDQAHAAKLAKRIRAVHVDKVKLLGVEEYGLTYTAHEIETERNLLGGPRRYSTGSGTVTIPENEK